MRVAKQFKLLFNHAGVRFYGQNMIWFFVEKFIRMVLGIGVGVLVARALKPAGYGELNYVLTCVAVFSTVAGFGIDSIAIRELVANPKLESKILKTVFHLRLLGFGVMLLLLGGYLLFWGASLERNILFCIIGCGYLFQTFQVFEFYFNAKVQIGYVVMAQIFALIISSGFRVFFAFAGYSLYYFAGVEVLYILLSGLGYAFFAYRNGERFSFWGIDYPFIKGLLKTSWPMWINSIVGFVYIRTDQFFIENMLGSYDLGIYYVAIRMIEFVYFIPMALNSTFLPALVRALQESKEMFRARISYFFSMMFYLHLFIVLVLWVFGKFIIDIYGTSYAESYPLFIINIWRILFCALGVSSSAYLLTCNLLRLSLCFGITSMVLNLCCSYYFINNWGIMGASYLSLLISLVSTFIYPLFSTKTRPILWLTIQGINPFFILKEFRRVLG